MFILTAIVRGVAAALLGWAAKIGIVFGAVRLGEERQAAKDTAATARLLMAEEAAAAAAPRSKSEAQERLSDGNI